MRTDKLHAISGNDINILYDDSTMSIIPVSNIISDNEENHRQFQTDIINQYSKKEINSGKVKERENPINDLHNVDRIMLCVSNDCNLRCKYCYAQGGSYGVPRSIMNIDTAKQFIDFCDKYFNNIKKIVFFGGEPMLNPKVIEYVCKHITRIFTGKNQCIPIFSIITNGTMLTSHIINIIKEYISEITVSIDGPAFIHDKNRVYENGNGSYAKAVRFIEEIKKIKDLDIQYEATYTRDAILEGYDHSSIKTYLEKNLDMKGVVINDSHIDKEYEYKNIKSITKEKMVETNFKCLPPIFWEILNLLINKHTNTFCCIGYKNFSVSVKGDIFVCHLQNEKKGCNLGTIFGDNLFKTPDHFSHLICDLNKHNKKCEECWCRNLCGGCTVECFYDEHTERLSETPMSEFCKSMQFYAEQILLLITQIRTDTELLNRFINRNNK